MTALLCIDPGTTDSGWVILDRHDHVLDSGIYANESLVRHHIPMWAGDLAIEMIEARGMPLGRETIETIFWTGRFMQAHRAPDSVRLVYRRDVKLHLCGSTKAKDSNVRQALIDLIGPPGVKANPGPTYGVKSHAWAALGVAATVREMRTR